MADKAQLTCNQGDIYPLCSLDNMVRSVSSSEAVLIPVLDSDGKIPTSYFPDDIGGGGTGGEIETDITSLGSAGGVVVEPESAYLWDVVSNQTLSASGSANAIGNSAFIRTRMLGGTVTGDNNVVLNGALVTGLANDCEIEFRETQAIVTPIWSGCEYIVTSQNSGNTSGYLDYGVAQGYKIIGFDSGGTAVLTSDTSGCYLYINAGGRLDVCPAASVGYCSVDGGDLHISSGMDILSNFSVTSGNMYVSSAAKVSGVQINPSGTMHVLAFGSAQSTHIHGNGLVIVSTGGIVYNTQVSAGTLRILTGGKASTVVVSSNGGVLSIGAGAVASIVTLRGGIHIDSGGTAFRTTIYNGFGYVGFSSGAIFSSTTVTGNATFIIDTKIAAANNTTVNANGYLHINSGKTITGTIIKGLCNCSSGATLVSTKVSSGGICDLYGYGAASNTTVNAGGTLRVQAAGNANLTTINSGGSLVIYRTGRASNTTINSGGRMFVSSGGRASSATVNSGGSLNIRSGGTALNVVSKTGAVITVSAGGSITYA